MPDLTIINNLEEPVHVAFSIIAPTNWKNNLQPTERWTTHLPTLPLHFEVRWTERVDENGATYRSREFSPEESWETGGMIGLACAAGTASVVTTAASTIVGMPGLGATVAGPLMLAASAGGQKYASMSENIRLYETRVWVPWFQHKEYSVRMVDGRCILWDLSENRQA